jgi:hypothetical protein
MEQFFVRDGKVHCDGKVAVLFSNIYKHPWNNDPKNKKIIMYYSPLVLYLINGGKPQDLVNGTVLTPKGEEVMSSLYSQVSKPRSWYEDLRHIVVKWVPIGSKIRTVVQDGYERIEYYNESDWTIG